MSYSPAARRCSKEGISLAVLNTNPLPGVIAEILTYRRPQVGQFGCALLGDDAEGQRQRFLRPQPVRQDQQQARPDAHQNPFGQCSAHEVIPFRQVTGKYDFPPK